MGDDTTRIDPRGPRKPSTRSPVVLGERYVLVRLLGAGGMGRVYLAHDRQLDEPVAVKVLDGWGGERAVEALRREVKLARRVTHPNVVRIFDVGVHDGYPILTMEYVEGETLGARLARTRLLVADAVGIASAVCAGLAAAHAIGVLHHDVKPSNVLLGSDGRVVLSDFGVAVPTTDARVSESDSGTPAYMAPEQRAGANTDERADIYAVGLLLHEMLAGQRFRARSDDGEMPNLLELRPEIPNALARVVARCLAVERDARFASATELAGALAAAMTVALPSSVHAPARLERPPERARVVLVPLFDDGGGADVQIREGFTTVLAAALSSRDLRVPSPGVVAAAHATNDDRADVARRLGAHAIVHGNLSRYGSNVQVRIVLETTPEQFVLLDDEVDVSLGGLVAAAYDAARAIRGALSVSSATDVVPRPSKAEAIELYLQGMSQLRRRWQEPVRQALAHFREALNHTPDDPLIIAACAVALARQLTFDDDDRAIDEVRETVVRAVEVAPDRVESYLSKATLEMATGDDLDAVGSLATALELDPHEAMVHERLGLLFLETGDVPAGLRRLCHAVALEPRALHPRWWMARAHALAGDWERCDELFGLEPTDPALRNVYWTVRARLLFWNPDPARVSRFADELGHASFDIKPLALGALDALRSGRVPDVLRVAIETVRSSGAAQSRRKVLWAMMQAELFARIDPSTALEGIERAAAAGCNDSVWLHRCPALGSLRSADAFEAARRIIDARAMAVAAALAPLAATFHS